MLGAFRIPWEINVSGRRTRGTGLPRVGTVEHKIRIGERDSWICGICHQPIDSALSVYESDDAATVDHIVPRVAGGTHEDSNLQIAHLKCNNAKGVRGYVGRSRQPKPAPKQPTRVNGIKMCSKCHEVPAQGYCRECMKAYLKARQKPRSAA